MPRDNTAGASAGGAPPARRGFTLIEVLVVIFILGVLAAIVVSVAGYVMSSSSRRETEATQKLLADAVQAYYDAGNPKAYPQDRYGDPATEPYEAPKSGRALVNFLTGKVDAGNDGTPEQEFPQTPPVKAAVEVLMKLPEEAWKGGWNESFRDGWGREMRYECSDPADPTRGGLGGRPVVISAGPDGDFGAPGSTQEEDNIRSDESQ